MKVLVEPERMEGGIGDYYLYKGHPFYMLSADNKYEVRYENAIILTITPQPCWKIAINPL